MDIESQEVRNNILFKNRKIVVAVIAIFVIGLTFYIYLEKVIENMCNKQNTM